MDDINIDSEALIKYWEVFEESLDWEASNVKESWKTFKTCYI